MASLPGRSASRRDLLRAGACAGALASIGRFPRAVVLRRQGSSGRGDAVEDLEPLIRLIVGTPRERCVEAVAAELLAGVPIRRLLAALLVAASRRVDVHHSLFVVHPVHRAGLDAGPGDRLRPLLWAVDAFKRSQSAERTGFGPPRPPLGGPLPPAERAEGDLLDALAKMDRERSELAAVALARGRGPKRALAVYWRFGVRDWSFLGHRAVAVASAWRALETVGWRHAEPVLRAVNDNLYSRGGSDGRGQCTTSNLERARAMASEPAMDRARARGTRTATLRCLRSIRTGRVDDACELAHEELARRGTSPAAIWDAIHLGACELLLRHRSSRRLDEHPLHAVTATNAMHYAYRACADAETRLLILLQGVGWVAEFTRIGLARNELGSVAIDDLEEVEIPDSVGEAAEDILSTLEPIDGRPYPPATRASQHAAASKALTLARRFPDTLPFEQRAMQEVWRAAGSNAHDVKLPVAVFEDQHGVGTPWRAHLLAASVHWLRSSRARDSALSARIEALGN